MKQPKYSSIIKTSIVLILCLLVNISSILAQIDVQPREQTVCKGETKPFQLELQYQINTVGFGVYRYQWYEKNKNGGWDELKIAGDGDSYTPENSGTFRCGVTPLSGPNQGKEELSVEVKLTVNDKPQIKGFNAPLVCDASYLVASVPKENGNLISGGFDIDWYEWKLDNVVVKKWNDEPPLTPNTIPNLEYFVTNAQHAGSSLTLTVSNICGSASIQQPVFVEKPIDPPTPVPWDYCEGDKKAPPMRILEDNVNTPVWYDSATGGTEIQIPSPNKGPTPDVSQVGWQTWWVLQKYTIPGGPTCVSPRTRADAFVRKLSDVPVFDKAFIEMCVNDPDMTLSATEKPGATLQWYNRPDATGKIAVAPQINTTKPDDEQIYYVTQTEPDKCESPIIAGKITVKIRARAKEDDLVLSPSYLELCPNNRTTIHASSAIAGSTFRWYKNSDKTEFFQEGSTFTTPVLMSDTAYYVTIQYKDKNGDLFCESGYSKSSLISVRDITLPRITAPPNLILPTDQGVCYATNVRLGRPAVSDNCTIYDSSNFDALVYTDPFPTPTVFPLGDSTLIWWVKDEAGNKSYALQAVSVRDREKPKPRVQGGCPAVIDKIIDENEYSAIVYFNLDYWDNCDGTAVKDSLNLSYHPDDKGKNGKDTMIYRPSGSVFPLGETRIRYFIFDKVGNVDTCEFKIIVRHPYRPIDVVLRPSARVICPGQEVVITPQVSGGSGNYKYMWKTPRPWTNAIMKDYPLNNTVYELTVDDGVDPPQTKSVSIEVLKTQPVTLTLEGHPMDQIFEGDPVSVTATPGFSSYKLILNNKVVQEIGLNNEVNFQAELGKYQIKVFATDANFCVMQDQLDIEIDSRKLPNVFTPNFDNINDIFLKGFDLQVFNRAGLVIYQGTEGWDGTYKGKPVPQGTYLYVVRRIMNNGELRIFKENVTLKR